jgi:hypothetical protein
MLGRSTVQQVIRGVVLIHLRVISSVQDRRGLQQGRSLQRPPKGDVPLPNHVGGQRHMFDCNREEAIFSSESVRPPDIGRLEFVAAAKLLADG